MKYYADIDMLLKDVEKVSNKALLYCWEYLAGKLQEEIGRDSYDTGQLARSITYMQVNDGVLVGSNLEYALVRENGRQPWKFPPLDALVGWTARKGMITGWATQKYDSLHYTDKGVIFVIARAIAERGIQWKHTFQNVFNKEKQNITNLYQELLQQWL